MCVCLCVPVQVCTSVSVYVCGVPNIKVVSLACMQNVKKKMQKGKMVSI